jgi:hypothetical protein
MLIQELLVDPDRARYAGTPEADALSETDALQEAQLISLRFDAVEGSVWLLFDCGGALQIESGNTAILVAQQIRSFSWIAEAPKGRMARIVMGSVPRQEHDTWSLDLDMLPAARLLVEAEKSEFFVGDVPGGDDPPPDYAEADEEEVRIRTASWSSEFVPVYAVFSRFNASG